MELTALNLPRYEVRLRGSQKRPQIFDFLRRRYVALTPEEWVRQHFVHYLAEQLGYPPSLMANEVALQMGEKRLRADTVIYTRTLQPLMIVEYKAPVVKITERVFEQASAYNRLLRVPYIVVSNGLEHFCCCFNEQDCSYSFLKDIPAFKDIIENVRM